MANHLTPEELSKELGIDRQEVIRVCVEEGVPIYQGKIDKTLFQAQLEALGAMPAHQQESGRFARRRTPVARAALRGGFGLRGRGFRRLAVLRLGNTAFQ